MNKILILLCCTPMILKSMEPNQIRNRFQNNQFGTMQASGSSSKPKPFYHTYMPQRTAYKYIAAAALATTLGIYSDASQISASISESGVDGGQLAAGLASWASRFILFGIVITLICATPTQRWVYPDKEIIHV